MNNFSSSIVKDKNIGNLFGNITFSSTIQYNDEGIFYNFINTGSSNSVGIGFNFGWYGQSMYVSDNIGIGSSTQI